MCQINFTIHLKTVPFCTNTMIPNTCPYLLAFHVSMVQLLYCTHLYCLHQFKLTSFPTNCQIHKQEVCPRHNRLVGGQRNNSRCQCEKNSGLRVPCAQYSADGKETSLVHSTVLMVKKPTTCTVLC